MTPSFPTRRSSVLLWQPLGRAEIVGPVDGRNQYALHACRDEFCIGHDPRNTTVAICEWMHLRYEKHHVHGTGECRLKAAVEIEYLPQGPFDVAGIDKDSLPGTVDRLLERPWSLVPPGAHADRKSGGEGKRVEIR